MDSNYILSLSLSLSLSSLIIIIVFNFVEVQPNPQKSEKSLGSLGMELGQDTWRFLGAWDPWDMQQN